LFLIFSFFNVSALLLLFNFEFLPITFLVVYVGAVAVLFLFVLMMLNIKLAELIDNYFSILPIAILFFLIFTFQLAFLMRFEFDFISSLDNISAVFLADFHNTITIKSNFFDLNYELTNIKLLGFVLFSKFLYHFIIAGVVLLLAMIAAIVLTLQKQFKIKTQNVYHQILKNYNQTVVMSTKGFEPI